MTARDRILARRAAFVAAAVGSLTSEARAECPEPPPEGECPPEPYVAPCLSAPNKPPPPPIEHPPRVCLSPPPPPPTNHDGMDLGLALPATPTLLLPLGGHGDDPTTVRTTKLAAPLALFVTRDLGPGALRFGVRSGLGAPTADVLVPLGGFLGYALAHRPSGWDADHHFGFGLELGGGAYLGEASRPYLEVAVTPLAFTFAGDHRYSDRRLHSFYAFELRGALLMLDTGPAEARSFGPAAFTLGVNFVFGFQIKKPSLAAGDYPMTSVSSVFAARRGPTTS